MADPACPRGCAPAEPDNCQASMIVACPLGFWTGEATDVNPGCGCHIRARCGCGGCITCGCFCGEDDDRPHPGELAEHRDYMAYRLAGEDY